MGVRFQLAKPNLVFQMKSETREPLRTVVRNLDAGDLCQRSVWLSGVSNQLRGISVDLIEIRAIRRDPAIGGATGHRSVQSSGGAVSGNSGTCRILGDLQATSVDVIATD